jgi:hypothetical protein
MRTDDDRHGGEIRVTAPGSSVVMTYASQCERDRSSRLAEARQQLAHEGALLPAWAELSEAEREDAAIEARNWLRAAIRAGIAPPCPLHQDEGQAVAVFNDAGGGEPFDFAADITRRARWGRDHNDGRPEPAWSTGERLAVALVLGDQATLDAEGYTTLDAARRLAGDISFYGYTAPVGTWLTQIRAALGRRGARGPEGGGLS